MHLVLYLNLRFVGDAGENKLNKETYENKTISISVNGKRTTGVSEDSTKNGHFSIPEGGFTPSFPLIAKRSSRP